MTQTNIQQEKKTLVIITACADELDYLVNYKIVDSTPVMEKNFCYYKNNGDNKINIYAAYAQATGGIDCALLTSECIHRWNPDIISLIGICAGPKGGVNFGDVVIPNRCFHYQVGAITEGVFEHDMRVENTLQRIINYAIQVSKKKEKLEQIYKDFPKGGQPPTQPFDIHIDPMASSDILSKDKSKIDEAIDRDRKTKGVDMESYAFMHVCSFKEIKHYFVVKAVSDFGEVDKDDRFRDYAKYTSTNIFIEMIKSICDDEEIITIDKSPDIQPTINYMLTSGSLTEKESCIPDIYSHISNPILINSTPTQHKIFILNAVGLDKSEIAYRLNIPIEEVYSSTDFYDSFGTSYDE